MFPWLPYEADLNEPWQNYGGCSDKVQCGSKRVAIHRYQRIKLSLNAVRERIILKIKGNSTSSHISSANSSSSFLKHPYSPLFTQATYFIGQEFMDCTCGYLMISEMNYGRNNGTWYGWDLRELAPMQHCSCTWTSPEGEKEVTA